MATAGFAPPTIPPAETGTPPREWSESVLASSPVRDAPATFSETPARTYMPVTTPQEAASLPLKTLKRQQASHALSSQGPHVSMPSTELKGAQPSERSGGVGALPGNLSESSVALLPDEREERAQALSPASARQRRDTLKPSVGAGDDEIRESIKKDEPNIPQDAMLSKDEPVASEVSQGVPAQDTETGVREPGPRDVAPTGSQPESQEASQEASSEQRRTASAPEEPSVKDAEESNVSPTPPVQDVQAGEEASKAPHAGKLKEGYGGDYHPAVLHPPPPGASVAEYQSPVGARQEVQDASTSVTDPLAGEGAEKKPGFMSVFKGEMKILAGKVRGDEHKIAEGKKLVHGEA